jgi:hypothetical protein
MKSGILVYLCWITASFGMYFPICSELQTPEILPVQFGSSGMATQWSQGTITFYKIDVENDRNYKAYLLGVDNWST